MDTFEWLADIEGASLDCLCRGRAVSAAALKTEAGLIHGHVDGEAGFNVDIIHQALS